MESGQPSGPEQSRGKAAFAFLLAVIGGLSAAFGAWLFTRTLTQIEAIGALGTLSWGVVLDTRFGIHYRQKYLSWRGRSGERWDRTKRQNLRWLTILCGVVAILVTSAGCFFLVSPGGLVELVTLSVLLVAAFAAIELQKRAVRAAGGPPPGSDVIEECPPVKWALQSERIWNGQWGFDAGMQRLADIVPVGHRGKAAVLIIAGLGLCTGTQAVAVGMRAWTQKQADNGGAVKHPTSTHSHQRVTPTPSNGGSSTSGSERTYDDNCGTEVVPGDGAPEPFRHELRIAWEELSPADGCAMRAYPIANGTAYRAAGRCRGLFWSLGIAREDSAAVLIEDAAFSARRISQSQELLGASSRVNIGEGDFHLVYTSAGPFLLIRKQKTDGNGATKDKPESCGEIEQGGEKYEVLLPGMAAVWLRFSEEVKPVWPIGNVSFIDGERASYRFESEGIPIAWGKCESADICEIEGEGLHLVSTPQEVEAVSVTRIQEHGPG